MPYEGFLDCECGTNIPVGYGYYFFNFEYICKNCGKINKRNQEVK